MTILDNIFQNADKQIDPVCKMEVNVSSPPGGTAQFDGATYYFCCSGCRDAFNSDPSKFLLS